MTPIWRYLTDPKGMTVQQLADAATMSVVAVRADLVELEKQGKVYRQRGAIGQPHTWWRSEKKPLNGLDALLIMGLAADYHASANRLREVLAKVGMRVKSKALQKVIVMCATAKSPHEIVRLAIEQYAADEFTESKAA